METCFGLSPFTSPSKLYLAGVDPPPPTEDLLTAM